MKRRAFLKTAASAGAALSAQACAKRPNFADAEPEGFDVHPFDPTRPLVLGGVELRDHEGLLGHSDADALIHAICDALLGAAGLDDIGD